MLLKRESIVAISFAIVIIFMLFIGIFSVHEIELQRQTTKNIYDHPLTVSNAVRQIRFLMTSIHDEMQEIATAPSEKEVRSIIQEVDEHDKRILQLFDVVHQRFLGNMEMMERARKVYLQWRPLREKEIAQAAMKHKNEDAIIREDDAYLDKLNAATDPILNYAMHKADFFYEQALKKSSKTPAEIYLLTAILGLLAIVIAIYIVSALRRAQRAEKYYLDLTSQNERRYRELLNAAPDGVVIVDDKQRIHMINRQAEQMFGYAAEELIGQPIDILVPDGSKDSHAEGMDAYLANPVARNVRPGRRLKGMRRDGTEFPVSISLGPVALEGEMLVTAMVRDISSELELEKKVRQAHKMEAVGTVVGGVAHEFNNILAGIVGNIYLAKRQLDAAEEPHMRNIEQGIQRAAGIVQQLMYFAHKGILKMKEANLAKLIRQCVDEVAVEGLSVEVDLQCGSPGCCIIKGDAEQIRKAILGLLSNAIDAVADGTDPHICVTLKKVDTNAALRTALPESEAEAYACLVFEDNGVGIPESDMERIFEPFYSTKEVGQGSGLGLSMIHGVVESHGGLVKVESEPGHGCTVTIYLPLLEERRSQVRKSSGGHVQESSMVSADGGRVVLIADDEPAVRETLQPVLESMRYRVLTAADGIEAIEAFQTNRDDISLLILDILMPHLDGAEVARRVRALGVEVPIIVITGYDKEAFGEYHLERLQNIRLLTKPFDMELLQQTVEELQQ